MQSFVVSIRLVAASMLVCVVAYATVIWGVGRTLNPHGADGSLIARADGAILGSSQITQDFTQPGYFWPRPSAVDYDGAGAGGSNKSPTSTDLTERGQKIAVRYGATTANPLPLELAAASGSGLDPNISEHAALYQASRIAAARGIPQSQVEALIKEQAFALSDFLAPDRLVNVLELNLALDRSGTEQQ